MMVGHPRASTSAPAPAGLGSGVGVFLSSLVKSTEIKGGVKCWNLLWLFCQRQQHL